MPPRFLILSTKKYENRQLKRVQFYMFLNYITGHSMTERKECTTLLIMKRSPFKKLNTKLMHSSHEYIIKN